MLLQLYAKFPTGEERQLYEAGAISTIQREARSFNREHPDNTTLVFYAYQIVGDVKELVLIGTPRNEKSLNWQAPEVKTRAEPKVTVLAVKPPRVIRDRVRGSHGGIRRAGNRSNRNAGDYGNQRQYRHTSNASRRASS